MQLQVSDIAESAHHQLETGLASGHWRGRQWMRQVMTFVTVAHLNNVLDLARQSRRLDLLGCRFEFHAAFSVPLWLIKASVVLPVLGVRRRP